MPIGRAVPIGIAAGLLSALFLLSVRAGGPGALILVGMSPLPVLMSGLSAGVLAAGLAVLAGMAASVLAGAEFGLAFADQIAVPAAVLVPLALAPPAPPSGRRLALGLTALGCGAFAVMYLALSGQPGGMRGFLQKETMELFAGLQGSSGLEFPEPIDRAAARVSFWALGAGLAFWLLSLAALGALAQGVLIRFGWNNRQLPAMASLEIPVWVGGLFAAALGAWGLGAGDVSYLGANLAVVLGVPLLLGGLAVVHAAVRRHPARLIVLIGVYVFAFASFMPIVLFVILGMLEQWFGLRRRLAGAAQGEQ